MEDFLYNFYPMKFYTFYKIVKNTFSNIINVL